MAELKVKVYSENGIVVGEETLEPSIFGISPKGPLIHQAVIAQMANSRSPIAHTKGRGEVSGGGKKPWKQKGTGRARHGSSRSPIWVGGGITFGPKSNRNFSQKINKKMKRKALLMSLTDKASSGKFVVLDSLAFDEYKTKRVAQMIKKLPITGSLLLVLPLTDEILMKSASNIPKTSTSTVTSLNLVDVLKAGTLLTTRDGLKKMREWFIKSKNFKK